MAQDEIGDTGALAAFPELVDVSDQQQIAVRAAEPAQLVLAFGGQTVAQMGVAHHLDALRRQEAAKFVIAADMLGHAVDELQNRPGLPLGDPADAVEPMRAVQGGKIKFLLHHVTSFGNLSVWIYIV